MNNFTNSIILPNDLPEMENKAFNPLDKKYLRLSLIRLAIVLVITVGGYVSFLLFAEHNLPSALIISVSAVLAAIFLYVFAISLIGFPRKGYLVRENDISFKKGIITFKLTTVPFNRIQHVEVNQGVLAKLFKLSSLKLFTAGGNASDLSIYGLPQDVAHNLKAFLSEKISEHE